MRRRLTAALLALAACLLAAPTASEPPTLTPPEHRRPEDQTYLTFPEWFLVHSPNEFATYTADHSPSDFPFLTHVAQLWSSYGAVTAATSEYDLNVGYHVMILVIATSTTVEYGIRAAYETLIGRLAEATATHGPTEEERFGAEVAREYVDFINVQPWYRFDFMHALERLWTDVPIGGDDLIRKLERRYMLTTEYLVKAGYGWLIAEGTAASYERPSPVTAVVLEARPRHVPDEVDLEILQELPNGRVVATLPRYEAFGRQATLLAHEDVRFVEIAGNSGTILVSAIGPRGWSDRREDVLLVQTIPTRPHEERALLSVPIPELAGTLRRLAAPPLQLEHVYDF